MSPLIPFTAHGPSGALGAKLCAFLILKKYNQKATYDVDACLFVVEKKEAALSKRDDDLRLEDYIYHGNDWDDEEKEFIDNQISELRTKVTGEEGEMMDSFADDIVDRLFEKFKNYQDRKNMADIEPEIYILLDDDFYNHYKGKYEFGISLYTMDIYYNGGDYFEYV